MKKKLLFISFVLVSSGLFSLSLTKEIGYDDVQLENIEALADGETPTAIGCTYLKGATCYIFDGNGHLVDKRKNQYPG